jgi:E3 ubiquitin-protein ligase NRDP1
MEYLNLGRFTCGVDDYFLCISCNGVVYNPKECSKCEVLFCQACGEKLSTCPSCTEVLSLQETSKYALMTYSQLTLRCQNYLQGCNQEGLIPETLLHQQNCEYESFTCANPLCNVKKMKVEKFDDDPMVCCENCKLIVSFDKILQNGDQELVLMTLYAFLRDLKERELADVTEKLKKNIEALDEKLQEKEAFFQEEKELRDEIEMRKRKVHTGKWNVQGKYWVCCLNKSKLAIGCKNI